MSDPIERTIRYATSVNELPDAWAFVMTYVDKVGPDPKIEISPYWVVSPDSDETPRRFGVVVSGMQEES